MNRLLVSLQHLLHVAYNRYESGLPVDKKTLVKEAQARYSSLKAYRGDILVPFAEQTLTLKAVRISHNGDYAFSYRFPDASINEEFVDPEEVLVISKGTQLDRLGSESGKYASPVGADGHVYSVAERALPYYFMQSLVVEEPSYHKYSVRKEITKENLIEAIEGGDISVFENDEDVRAFLLQSVKRRSIIYGRVAPISAFGSQGCGQGLQYRFPISIGYLEALGFLKG